MRYKYSSKVKQMVNKTTDTVQKLLKIKDTIENPIRVIIDKM